MDPLEFLRQLDDGGVWLAAVVAGFVALGWIAKKVRHTYRTLKPWVRKVGVVIDLAEYELQHNGGGSIKDAASRIPAIEANAVLAAERFETHLILSEQRAQLVQSHAEILAKLAEALPVIARSQPHPSDADPEPYPSAAGH